MFTHEVSRRSKILLGERKTTVFQRFSAKAIDILVMFAAFMIAKSFSLLFGAICASLFAAFHDSFGNGQSFGKRIMGIRVIEDQTGISCTAFHSLVRNFPFVLAFVFSFIPVLWAFALFAALPVLALEAYIIYCIESGVRLGDVMGNTLVVEHFDEELGASSQDSLL